MTPSPSLRLYEAVLGEIDKGRIRESYIEDPGFHTEGLCDGPDITINPVHAVVDTVVHETLHRLHPEWSEPYVRNRTRFLLNRLTDKEILRLHAHYQARVRRVKTPKRLA